MHGKTFLLIILTTYSLNNNQTPPRPQLITWTLIFRPSPHSPPDRQRGPRFLLARIPKGRACHWTGGVSLARTLFDSGSKVATVSKVGRYVRGQNTWWDNRDPSVEIPSPSYPPSLCFPSFQCMRFNIDIISDILHFYTSVGQSSSW